MAKIYRTEKAAIRAAQQASMENEEKRALVNDNNGNTKVYHNGKLLAVHSGWVKDSEYLFVSKKVWNVMF